MEPPDGAPEGFEPRQESMTVASADVVELPGLAALDPSVHLTAGEHHCTLFRMPVAAEDGPAIW